MLINVVDVKDNPDGTADVTFNMDEKAAEFLISYAIKDILEKQLERHKDEQQKHQTQTEEN